MGLKRASFWRGRIETLTGAILGLRRRYVLILSLILKECSKIAVMILPKPNEGSITLGVNFSSMTLTIFCSNWMCCLSSSTLSAWRGTSILPSASNLSFRADFSSSLRFSKYELMAWEFFLNYLPTICLLTTIVVCFSGRASLNLREASNLTPEPLVCWVKS